MSKNNYFKKIDLILKENQFEKKGTCWYKFSADVYVIKIHFQKDKAATQSLFEITLNVGIYVRGTNLLIFNEEKQFDSDVDCFFRKRPIFFGNITDWWEIDLNGNYLNTLEIVENTVKNQIIPFFDKHKSFDSLVAELPISDWKSNYSFHSELLRVACGYFIFGNKVKAKELLEVIKFGKSIWSENADRILLKM